jgi:hypothetical protein
MTLHLFSLTVEIHLKKKSKDYPAASGYEHLAHEKSIQVLADVQARRS